MCIRDRHRVRRFADDGVNAVPERDQPVHRARGLGYAHRRVSRQGVGDKVRIGKGENGVMEKKQGFRRWETLLMFEGVETAAR